MIPKYRPSPAYGSDLQMIPTSNSCEQDLTDDHQPKEARSQGLSSRDRKLDRSIISFMADGSEHRVSEMKEVFPRASYQQLAGALVRLTSKGIVDSECRDQTKVYRLSKKGAIADDRYGTPLQGDDGRDSPPPEHPRHRVVRGGG